MNIKKHSLHNITGVILILTLFLYHNKLWAKQLNLNAQEITFAQKDGSIIAKRDVNADYLQHNLSSQYLKYNKERNHIIAKYKVKYINNINNLKIKASQITSNKEFSKISALNLHIKLDNKINITGKELIKTPTKLSFNQGTYTPCALCKHNKEIIPTWEIGAKNILYDESKNDIYFKHAFFKIYKIPVLYFPKFIYPGPKVKKRSGILPIRYESDSLLNNKVSIPIFFNLAPNYDFTYTPTIFSKNNILHQGNFRYLNKMGKFDLKSSYVKENSKLKEIFQSNNINTTNEDKHKWSLDTKYLFNNKINNKNYGFEGNIFDASGKDFLERYQHNYEQYFNSNFNINQISDKTEFIFDINKFYNFSNQDRTYELPHISWQNIKQLKSNIYYQYNIDYTALKPVNNTERQRISYKDNLYKDYTTKDGLLFNTTFSNIIRGYYNDSSNVKSDFYANYIPQLSLKAQKPYIKYNTKSSYIITPKTSLIISPNTKPSNKVTNLDSATTLLNYANLLENNKISGADTQEKGLRFNYGLNKGIYYNKITLENFIGQSFYSQTPDNISRSSGIKKDFSDIVGNFKLSYNKFVNFSYNYKLKESNFNPYHNQINLNINAKYIQFAANYSKYKYAVLDGNSSPLNYLTPSLTIKIPKRINITAFSQINLLDKKIDPNSGPVESSIEFELFGDCINYLITIKKNHIDTTYSKSDLQIIFNFKLPELTF